LKRKILIIEDNEQNLYLATFLLERGGYEIVAARTGTEGIELAATVQPAQILLDIQLPGMDGYEVLEHLRNNPALDHVPITAVTSHAMVGDRERCLAAGCNGYIEKPIDPDTFLIDVEHHLPDTKSQPDNPS
jgi:two-component system cell cycle response regulator DivK